MGDRLTSLLYCCSTSLHFYQSISTQWALMPTAQWGPQQRQPILGTETSSDCFPHYFRAGQWPTVWVSNLQTHTPIIKPKPTLLLMVLHKNQVLQGCWTPTLDSYFGNWLFLLYQFYLSVIKFYLINWSNCHFDIVYEAHLSLLFSAVVLYLTMLVWFLAWHVYNLQRVDDFSQISAQHQLTH